MPEVMFKVAIDGVPNDVRPGDPRVGAALAVAPVPDGRGGVQSVQQVLATTAQDTTETRELIEGRAPGLDLRKRIFPEPSAASRNSAAIKAAMAAMAAAGGGNIYLPATDIFVSEPIDNCHSGVTVWGTKEATGNDFSSTGAGTRIVAAGGAFVVLKHRTPYASERNIPVSQALGFCGGGFRNLTVIGNGLAPRLLEVDSIIGGRYDVNLIDAVGDFACVFKCGVTGQDLLTPCDVQRVRGRINVRQYGQSPAEIACGGVLLDGSVNANFSFNRNIEIIVQHQNGDAVRVNSADNNDIKIKAFRAGNNPTGRGLYVRAVRDPNTLPVAGTTNFFDITCGAPIIFEGLETSGVTQPSNGNIRIDIGNGTPLPTIGTGCSVGIQTYEGEQGGWTRFSESFGETLTSARLAAQYRQTNPGASAVFCNQSSNGIHVIDGISPSSHAYAFSIDGSTGSFRFLGLKNATSYTFDFPLICGSSVRSPKIEFNATSYFGFFGDEVGFTNGERFWAFRANGDFDVVSGGLRVRGLPNAQPAPGSQTLWYDPADGNRVKFAP